MAHKIIVSLARSLPEGSVASKRQAVADLFCVCPEDVIFLSDGLTVSVVDLPDELVKAREKADKEAEAAAEKAREEQAEAEKKAAAEAAKAASPAPAAVPVDYEMWTSEELHAEATKRDLAGRSSMDKAALVKALQKADKAK